MLNLLIESQTVTMFIPLIVAVLVPLSMWSIDVWHRKVVKKQNKNISGKTFIVRYNSLMCGALIFLATFTTIASALFPILYACDIPDGPPLNVVIGTACGFGAVSIVSWLFVFFIKRWQIAVSEEGLRITPMFKKSRKVLWEEIERVKVYGQPYGARQIFKVYIKGNKKKVFSFNSYMAGGNLLAEEIKKHVILLIFCS